MIRRDVFKFLQVYVVLLIAFGCAFTALDMFAYNNGGSPYSTSGVLQVPTVDGVARFLSLLYNFEVLSVGVLSGNFSMPDETFVSLNLIWLFVILGITFIVITALLLFNMLIAMMGNTFDDTEAKAKLLFTREKLNITDTFESGTLFNIKSTVL